MYWRLTSKAGPLILFRSAFACMSLETCAEAVRDQCPEGGFGERSAASL